MWWGIVQQHRDLRFREQVFGRQFRRGPSEQRKGRKPPRDHRVQRDRPLDPLRRVVGRLLHVAPRFQDPVPVLDAPAQGVEVEHLHRRRPPRDGKGRQQQPFHRFGAGGRLGFVDMCQVQFKTDPGFAFKIDPPLSRRPVVVGHRQDGA